MELHQNQVQQLCENQRPCCVACQKRFLTVAQLNFHLKKSSCGAKIKEEADVNVDKTDVITEIVDDQEEDSSDSEITVLAVKEPSRPSPIPSSL